jgi:hypothetical protein
VIPIPGDSPKYNIKFSQTSKTKVGINKKETKIKSLNLKKEQN